MIISPTKERIVGPTGTVPKNAFSFTSKRKYSVPLAKIDPSNCEAKYNGTYTYIQVLATMYLNLYLQGSRKP